jgi:hypothetical protein
MAIAPGLDVVIAGMIKDAHAAASPAADSPPPPIPGRSSYRIADVTGTWTRAVNGSHHFQNTISHIPVGPVFVTLRFEPNDANKYGISAYVSGKHVGWLATDWTASDPWVKFVRRLNDAGVLPRFQGLHRLTGNTGDHIINFDVPGPNDGRLGDIARRITGKPAG